MCQFIGMSYLETVCQQIDMIGQLGDSQQIQLEFTGMLFICYVAHKAVIWFYELRKCEVYYSQIY